MARSGTRSVLVVDDDPAVARVRRGRVLRAGAEVTVVSQRSRRAPSDRRRGLDAHAPGDRESTSPEMTGNRAGGAGRALRPRVA